MHAFLQKPWFSPKRYGYGATPSTWQGWLATILFVAFFTIEMNLFKSWPRLVAGALLLGLFIALVYAKTSGEWRWRWGGR